MKMNNFKARATQLLLLIGIFATYGFSQSPLHHEYEIDDLPFEVEMRRLDDVAKTLKSKPEMFVYLIGYNKEGTPKSAALKRLNMSKHYLIKRHRVSSKRIKTLYAGSQTGLVMRIIVTEKDPQVSIKPKPD